MKITKYIFNGNKLHAGERMLIAALLSIVLMIITFNAIPTMKTAWENDKNAQIIETCRIKSIYIENNEKIYMCRRNSNLNEYITFNESQTKTENLYIERKMKIMKNETIE